MTMHPGNLAGRPPMGLKAPKPEAKGLTRARAKRSAMPKRSKKRLAYLASDERKAGLAHLEAVGALPCLVCGFWPVERHHEGKPRSDLSLLPLCPRHHRREYGPGAYHYSPSAFYAAHGSSEALLERVREMIAAQEADCLGEWL